MAFIPTDIFPTLSGAPRDGGVRTVRDETPPKSVSSRKGFSSVLRSVRDEAGRAAIREADGARPVNKADDGSRAKEAKGLNDSTQPARPHASSQAAERTRTDNSDDKNTGDAETNLESSPRQNDVGSGSQEQGTAPISNLISVPVQPQVVDQTEVQTEPHPFGDASDLDRGSQHLLSSHESTKLFGTTPEALGDRSATNSAGAASHRLTTQQSNPLEPQAKDNETAVQTIEQSAAETVKDSTKVAADYRDPSPASRNSLLDSALPPQGPGIPHVGTTSLEGNVLVAKDETLKHDGSPVNHSVLLPT